MKKHKVTWEPHEKGLIVVGVLLALFALLAPQVFSATVYYPVYQSHTGIDTLKVIVKERSGDFDSTTYEWTTIPVLDSIPLTIGKHYNLLFSYFWNGEPQWLEDPAIPVHVAPETPFDILNIRYVDLNASAGGDGLTWSTAWDSLNDISSITTGSNYHIFVNAGDYGVEAACSLSRQNMTLEAVGGYAHVHYNTDTLASGSWDSTNNLDVSECIYVNASGFRITGFRFDGDSLFAYPEYNVDPDQDSLSITNRGGKNGIFLDTAADYGVIENCIFENAYKPVAGYYRADSLRTANYMVWIQNNKFINNEYHSIDAPIAYTTIRWNEFINTAATDHPNAGTIQMISRIAAYNSVYENYFNGYGYGIYANVSDSNFAANNYFGVEKKSDGSGQAIRAYDTAYADPVLAAVGNYAPDWQETSYLWWNILPNAGFEVLGRNRHEAPYWAGNSYSNALKITGVSYEVAPFGFVDPNVNSLYTSGNTGHSLFMMVGDSAAYPYMYQNSNVFYLDVGEAQFSAKVYGNSNISAGDTLRFALYEDTLGDESFSLYEEYKYVFTDNLSWNDARYNFTIDNRGAYYLSMHVWKVDSGDGAYFDNIFLSQYSGTVTGVTATVDTSEIKTLASNNPSIFYGPSASGSGLYNVLIYTIDTSGTDDTVASTKIDINTTSGSDYAGPKQNTTGLDSFNLDAGTYLGLAYKTGYYFYNTTLSISGNDTVSILGYNTVTTVSSPSDTGFSRVYGYVKDRGTGIYGAKVRLVLPEHAYDSCNNTILITKVFEDNTDGDGFFSMDVPKSSCLNRLKNGDLMQYSVEVQYKSYKTKKHEFSIPADSSTYYLRF